MTRSLTFCDLSPFYAPTGGGIRTYHEAKLAWFAAQQKHRYVLIVPGPQFSIEQRAPTATVVSFYGAPIRAGYRMPLDFAGIRAFVEELRPDVIETGDPWISGPLGLWFRRRGYTSFTSSFYHSDPISTYFAPDEHQHGVLGRVRQRIGDWVGRPLTRMQQCYDLTLASSAWVEQSLQSRGVARMLRVPFGVDPIFFDVGRARVRRHPRTRFLYVGRLQADKAIELLIDAIPALLQLPNATLTIVGSGPAEARVRAMASPSLRMTGYVSSRTELAQLFADHDVLLAPGPHETFGLAALEGLASGLSLVAPDAGGAAEMLNTHVAPHVFRRNDVAAFVDAARRASEADALTESRASLAVADRYGTWPDVITREIEVYCRFLSPSTT